VASVLLTFTAAPAHGDPVAAPSLRPGCGNEQ
jgi:hypothetical protein